LESGLPKHRLHLSHHRFHHDSLGLSQRDPLSARLPALDLPNLFKYGVQYLFLVEARSHKNFEMAGKDHQLIFDDDGFALVGLHKLLVHLVGGLDLLLIGVTLLLYELLHLLVEIAKTAHFFF
jgi:hypothetical protein